VALYGVNPHSDFHPIVSLEAPTARYLGHQVRSLPMLWRGGLPVLETTGGWAPLAIADGVTDLRYVQVVARHWYARWTRSALLEGEPGPLREINEGLVAHVEELRQLSGGPVPAERV